MINISLADNNLCERCGSKKRVSKTWKENIPTMTGKKTTVVYSQIVCTNPVCQKAFEENLEKETKKREILQMQKEERDRLRKEKSGQPATKNA